MIDRQEARQRDIRGWVGYAIRGGNSVEWLLGWMVKTAAEVAVSAIVGFLLYRLVAWQTQITDIGEIYGAESASAVLVLFIGGLYLRVFRCEFDREGGDGDQ